MLMDLEFILPAKRESIVLVKVAPANEYACVVSMLVAAVVRRLGFGGGMLWSQLLLLRRHLAELSREPSAQEAPLQAQQVLEVIVVGHLGYLVFDRFFSPLGRWRSIRLGSLDPAQCFITTPP